MTSGGIYRSLDVSGLLEKMPEVAQALRTIYEVDDTAPGYVSQPHVAAVGPLTTSSSHVLVSTRDLPVWDVNGYYRSLGITAPYRPTKRELMRAYQRVNGQANHYRTYAFKRLINAEYRRFYDARELGQPVDDIFRWRMLKEQASRWAKERTLRTGIPHDASDFIPADLQDKIKNAVENNEVPERELSYASSTNTSWGFGYYLWDTRHRDDMTLSIWQSMLIKAFWNQGLCVRFAVGYFERTPSAAAVRYRLSHPDVEAILIRSGLSPTPDLADVVVATYHTVDEVDSSTPLYVDAPADNPEDFEHITPDIS